MAAVNLPAGEAMRNITLHVRVTGIRRARLRMWMGAQMFKLGAFVMGCGIEVEHRV